MRNVVAEAEAAHFLATAKQLISDGRWTYIRRKDTLDTLARYGWRLKDMAEIVQGITPKDYFNGPVPDDNGSFGGEIWECGPCVHTEEGALTFYTKLKIVEDENGDQLLVMSFHPPKWPISYPHK